MISASIDPLEKALIAALYESGARIGELMDLSIRNVSFDDLGAVMLIQHGKTGPRRVRLVNSVPYLSAWLDTHPLKEEEDPPLWVRTKARYFGQPMHYTAVKVLISRVAKKAGITKPINPHYFRHSRATYLANHLTEAQMCEYLGWILGSEMPRVYIHLSGRDVDKAILKMNGLTQDDKNAKEDSKMQPISCPRCRTQNGSTSKQCTRCGMALDAVTAIKMSADSTGLAPSNVGVMNNTEGNQDDLTRLIEQVVESKLKEMNRKTTHDEVDETDRAQTTDKTICASTI